MAGAFESGDILREPSNSCCLPGKVGGSPVVLACSQLGHRDEDAELKNVTLICPGEACRVLRHPYASCKAEVLLLGSYVLWLGGGV